VTGSRAYANSFMLDEPILTIMPTDPEERPEQPRVDGIQEFKINTAVSSRNMGDPPAV